MYFSNQTITGDFECTLEAKLVNGSGVRIGFANSNSTSFNKSAYFNFTFTDYRYIKFRRVGSTWTVTRSTDGTNWNSQTLEVSSLTSEDCYFFVYVQIPSGSDERRLTYKNLRIYPI